MRAIGKTSNATIIINIGGGGTDKGKLWFVGEIRLAVETAHVMLLAGLSGLTAYTRIWGQIA